MRPQPQSPPGRRGYSLIELAIVSGVIAALAGLLLGAAQNARGLATDTRCLSNLRQVSVALRLYMLSFNSLPNDQPEANLAADLRPFLEDRACLTCPLDHATPGRSYDPFYVARRCDTAAQFVVGCPRHNGSRSAVNLMAESSVNYVDLALVHFVPQGGTNTPGPPHAPTAQSPQHAADSVSLIRPGQAVSQGKLNFEDGSSLTMSGNGRVILLQSFRKTNGVLYTIVKIVTGSEAEVDVQVNPGSEFEIITPAAIAGVRGTRFTVTVAATGAGLSSTTIAVHSGRVWVARREALKRSPRTLELKAGERAQVFRKAAARTTKSSRRQQRAKNGKAQAKKNSRNAAGRTGG